MASRAPTDLAAPSLSLDDGQQDLACCDLHAMATGADNPAAVASSAPARAAVAMIRVYQLARTGRTSPCRFLPTCSQYAASAIERHGLRRGLRLALGRLARCRPGGPFGSDPVPE